MATPAAHEPAPCDVCGVPLPDDGWIALEVQRPTETNDPAVGLSDFLSAHFCSQEHAARWLAQPLPDPKPVLIMPRTARDRAADIGWVLLLALIAATAIVGVVAIVNWLLAR